MPLQVPSYSESGPSLPPHRDWRPTLIRAHQELVEWSHRIQAFCVELPCSSDQGVSLDGLFSDMIAILLQHAPAQRRTRRRRQPSWWTLQFFEACVARTGDWRNFRRTPVPELHDRFFGLSAPPLHRVVRRCRMSFWSQWQDNVKDPSRVNPRAAAARVRHTFRE